MDEQAIQLPHFRSDLTIVRSGHGSGDSVYLVTDPLSGLVFALKAEEYYICRQLDGVSLPGEVQSGFREQFRTNLDLVQLDAFIRQLEKKGLLTGSNPEASALRLPEQRKKWSLFNPEKSMEWLSRKFRWCYTPSFVTASAVILILAAGVLFSHFTKFCDELNLLAFPMSIFEMLAIMYLFVNAPQEVVRGMTFARFGGPPEEFGVSLALDIMPRFYCYGNPAKIVKRSRRAWYFFSPSFYALLAGSIGILIWKMTSFGSLCHQLSLALALVCIFDTAIRLNVLWPAEGHYLMANHLGIQNLRKRSMDVAKAWVFRRPLPEPLSRTERKYFILYGLLTTLATVPILLFVGYTIGKNLITYYMGAGALAFASMAAIKYRKGIMTFLKESGMFKRISNINFIFKRGAKARVVFWTSAAVIALLFPYRYDAGGSFKLLPMERIELHTKVTGEVTKVLVRENSIVSKGDVQALIDTSAHQKNLDAARAGLDKAKFDLQLLESGRLPGDIKKAEQQVESAKTHADYSRKEEARLSALYREGVISQEEYENGQGKADVDAQNLEVARANLQSVKDWPHPQEIEAQRAVVRDLQAKVKFYDENLKATRLVAPISGRVVTPYIEMKVGQYLKEGDLFAAYENKDTIQAEIRIPESDIGEVKVGAKVKVRPQAYPTRFFYGTVVLIAPIATLENQNNAFSSKVVRVITEIPNDKHELWPEMTGEAKIKGGWKPFILAFTRAIVRFFMVEVWSWFP